jgi:hypothetical protein
MSFDELPSELHHIVLELLDISSLFSLHCVSKKYMMIIMQIDFTTLKKRYSPLISDSGMIVQEYDVMIDAIRNGHINFLEWYVKDRNYDYNIHHMNDAAEYGHINIIKHLRENDCPWDDITCSNAVDNGHFGLVIWLNENGCEWDAWSCTYAAQNGDFELLQWLHENGCPWDAWTCSYAAQNGYLDILKWLRDKGCNWNTYTCSSAAQGGHLEVLKYLRSPENMCPWDGWSFYYAAEGGHMEILKYLSDNGCPYEEITILSAARSSSIESMEWLLNYARDKEYYIQFDLCDHAAKYGHLEMVKYLRDVGYRCDKRTLEHAIIGDNHEIITWLRENLEN